MLRQRNLLKRSKKRVGKEVTDLTILKMSVGFADSEE